MKEAILIKKVREELNDWVCWKSPNIKFHSNDIFSIWDLCCWKNDRIKFIQVTTSPNKSKHRKKIEAFMKENNLRPVPTCSMELWCYNKKKKLFDILKFT